ncbi:pancreatic triacylglycerol lipase-like [Maniola jurtina]|uniref:pancreatic triacylglycerol lipase-like n=1 Tax=Maniola jurtina TaxID=191418 RepID=UPI001E68769E|nr:pancreatic triacylglycerol lipase-like [Maniola jurtina]
MKTVLCLLCVAVCYAIAGASSLVDGKYSRYIEFPDGDGVMQAVDLLEPVDTELLREVERNPANNNYLLYTRRNRRSSQRLIINNVNSIRNSNFNANHQTVVIAHGWLGNQNTNINPTIRDAYLNKGEANVIVLDWRRLAVSTYPTAAAGVPAVGRGLGQFLEFLHSVTGQPFNRMHLAGFSLGAHLVGNAGRQLGGRVARVTGLDPAGPLWNRNSERLRPTDGVYVEAIHTDGGTTGLGIGTAIANADFFPNGGNSQPGCYNSICNHNRAYELFASTVTRNHLVGRQCSNTAQISANSCRGSSFHMGNDDLNKTGSGLFRVNTGRRYPF